MKDTDFESIVKVAAQDTQKGSEIVARMFYRILRRNGFTKNQIIDIASDMLNCLIKSLNNYEERTKRD